jgi:hypothetical protein
LNRRQLFNFLRWPASSGLFLFWRPSQAAPATPSSDALDASIAVKAPVRTVTTTNLTLAGLQTVGGVALVEGDRVLVRYQTNGAENGIYIASAAAWQRAKDFDGVNAAVNGTLVLANFDNGQGVLYQVVSQERDTRIGRTPIAFRPFTDPKRIYEQSELEARANVTPFNYAYPWGDVRRYGAVDPSGVVSSSEAFQRATNTGHVVSIPAGRFRVSGITHTGRVVWRGEGRNSILMADKRVLTVVNGTDSIIDNLYLENITAPWIITRNPDNWDADIRSTLRRSNDDGYQPTINDHEIWPKLRDDQKEQIGPSLWFHGNASHIEISRIFGRFVTLEIYDGVNCTFRDIDIRGGGGLLGSIVFWNHNGQVGRNNRIINVITRFSSNGAVTLSRNHDGILDNVITLDCGESGVKFWKGDYAGKDVRCYNMTLSNIKSSRCYYDGADLFGDDPPSPKMPQSHQIANLEVTNCGGTGINLDGALHQITGVKISHCQRFGWWGFHRDCLISDVECSGNNKANDINFPEVLCTYEDNVWCNVRIHSVPERKHMAIVAPGRNSWMNVKATGRPLFFGKLGAITARLVNVFDDQTDGNRLFNGEVADFIGGLDERGVHFWPLRTTTSKPSGAVSALVTDPTPNHEFGKLRAYVVRDGTLVHALQVVPEPLLNGPSVFLPAPSASPSAALMDQGSIAFYLDQSDNNLKCIVKYSNGAVRTGTVALT